QPIHRLVPVRSTVTPSHSHTIEVVPPQSVDQFPIPNPFRGHRAHEIPPQFEDPGTDNQVPPLDPGAPATVVGDQLDHAVQQLLPQPPRVTGQLNRPQLLRQCSANLLAPFLRAPATKATQVTASVLETE